ncbi:MAG: serine/threonine protein kinase, partial [Anaerolineae bacterium]|nr:serine/threonine protein kinase [Anaerolineae bacterium]
WRKALSGDPQNLIQRLLSAFEALRTRRGHSEYVFSVAWSPNRWLVASGSKDRTIHLWDAETGQLVCTLTGHTGAVLSLAWSPNGRYLASGSADGTIIIWGIPE